MDLLGSYFNRADQVDLLRALLKPAPGDDPRLGRVRRQSHRRLRPHEIEELAAAYQAGATIPQLAARYGSHRTTISAILERQGVSRRFRVLGPAEVAEAIALYASGLSLAAVGSRLGCDGGTVGRVLRAAGVQLRERRGWKRRQENGRG